MALHGERPDPAVEGGRPRSRDGALLCPAQFPGAPAPLAAHDLIGINVSVLTKSTHVESRFCGRSRQGKAAFCTPVNPCVRSVCSRSVVVGIKAVWP